MTTLIAPTVLCETDVDWTKSNHRALASVCKARVHIDVTDGEFAPVFTVGADKLWWPQEWQVDIHAMVARPSEYVNQLIQLKPYSIIFHAEASEDLCRFCKKCAPQGFTLALRYLKNGAK